MNYFGSKNGSGVYQTIINYIPPHKVYIEAFLGSGAILRYKRPAEINIGIEIDKKTIKQFWNPTPPGKIIINENAIQWLKDYQSHGSDVLIYLDPPYPISSRRNKVKVYRHELTDKQHEALLQFCVNCKSQIIISTYPNQLYESYLFGWNKAEYYAMTRKGKAKELLYTNFSPPTVLHDYNFLGKDFTDRQRVRRKIQRFINKLGKLPIVERNAIINSFIDGFRKS
jgi:site-specific DNA-adenine methylase